MPPPGLLRIEARQGAPSTSRCGASNIRRLKSAGGFYALHFIHRQSQYPPTLKGFVEAFGLTYNLGAVVLDVPSHTLLEGFFYLSLGLVVGAENLLPQLVSVDLEAHTACPTHEGGAVTLYVSVMEFHVGAGHAVNVEPRETRT